MSPTATSEQVETVIREALIKFGAPAGAIGRDATFDALDVDSLDLVELGQVIEDEFGVELKGSDVKGITSVGELIDLVIARA